MGQGYRSVTTAVEAGRSVRVQEWPMDDERPAGPGRRVRVDRGLHLRRRAAGRLGRQRRLVLPTAAAYQHPERVVLEAAEWFDPLGGQVEGLMVLDRTVGQGPGHGGRGPRRPASSTSPAGPPSTSTRCSRARPPSRPSARPGPAGAVVAGSAAGAMVLTDPMVDPRGGALTVGLGLVDQLAVVPQFGDGHEDAHGQKLQRTVALAPDGLPVVGHPRAHRAAPGPATAPGATRARRRRWCSSTARGPRGSAPLGR